MSASAAQQVPDERLRATGPASRRPARRFGTARTVLKRSLIVIVLALMALGASIALTDPNPSTLPSRALQWIAATSSRVFSTSPAVPEEKGRPALDEYYDDSGYATAIRFSKPIADPASLAQIRDSVVGRGRRGIAYLEDKLASLPPGDPATPSTAADHPPAHRLAADVRGSMDRGGRAVRPGAGRRPGPPGPVPGQHWTPCGASPP